MRIVKFSMFYIAYSCWKIADSKAGFFHMCALIFFIMHIRNSDTEGRLSDCARTSLCEGFLFSEAHMQVFPVVITPLKKYRKKNMSTQIEKTEKSLALVMFGERVLFLQMLRESQRIFGSLNFVGLEYVLTSDRMWRKLFFPQKIYLEYWKSMSFRIFTRELRFRPVEPN